MKNAIRFSMFIPKSFLLALQSLSEKRGSSVAQLIRDAIHEFLKAAGALCIVLMVGCASVPFEGWTKADTARQVTYTALHIADWAQTVDISKSNGEYYESGLAGIVIGEYPEESDVHLYFASTLILHTAISAMLSPKYRSAWQYVWIGAEGVTAAHNYSIGLRFGF